MKLNISIPQFSTNNDWWDKAQEKYIPEWRDDIEAYWSKEKDPISGQSWRKRKDPKPWKKLNKTGSLFNSAELKLNSGEFSVKSNFYGKFHQSGTNKMAQRRWVGIPKEGLIKLTKYSAEEIVKKIEKINYTI